MIRLTHFSLLAALALAPSLANAQTFIQRFPGSDPQTRGFAAVPQGGDPTAATAEQWSAWADALCGGDSLIIYEEDENGEPVNGTVRTSCLDD